MRDLANADGADPADSVIATAAATIPAAPAVIRPGPAPCAPGSYPDGTQQVDPRWDVLGGHGEQAAYGFFGVVHKILLIRCHAPKFAYR